MSPQKLCIFELQLSQMPWKEFTIDNTKNTIGSVRRMDKAFIMLYKSPDLVFRITARHHDGHFKYYLDCLQANIFERWFGVPGVDNKDGIKLRGIRLISSALDRNDLRAFIELRKVEVVCSRPADSWK